MPGTKQAGGTIKLKAASSKMAGKEPGETTSQTEKKPKTETRSEAERLKTAPKNNRNTTQAVKNPQPTASETSLKNTPQATKTALKFKR